MKSLYSLLLLSLSSNLYLTEAYVSCYYDSLANYRYDKGHFSVSDINPFLCDELIYSFAGLNSTSNEVMVLDPYLDLYDNYGKGGYDQFTNLKATNPVLKTTLSIGGWEEGSEKYSIMAADSAKRQTFVFSVIKLLVDHKFDGLDMDWEFPGSRGGLPADKFNYVVLLQELRSSLDFHGLSLTAAIPADINLLEAGYDIEYLSLFLDRIHVMSYDFHGAWENHTHHHSPLGPHPMDSGYDLTLNTMYTIDYLIGEKADPNMLVLGVATYGRCYTLESPDSTDFYAPSSGPGRQGPYSRENGFLGYNEICELQQLAGDWVTVNDPSMNEPYTYRLATNIWCGYDDSTSAKKKANYAFVKGLGGIMTRSIDTDDFRGVCGRDHDLIRSMREGFEQQVTPTIPSTTLETVVPTETDPTTTDEATTTDETTEEATTTDEATTTTEETTTTTEEATTTTEEATTTTEEATTTTEEATMTTEETTTTTEESTTTSGGSGMPECDLTGSYYIPHEECDKYWQCSNGQAFLQSCPAGLYWNPDQEVCDYPGNVDTSNCIEPSIRGF